MCVVLQESSRVTLSNPRQHPLISKALNPGFIVRQSVDEPLRQTNVNTQPEPWEIGSEGGLRVCRSYRKIIGRHSVTPPASAYLQARAQCGP